MNFRDLALMSDRGVNLNNMRSIRILIFTFLISIFITVSVLTNSNGASDLKIGVVGLNRVFDQYGKRKFLDKQLKELENSYEKMITKKRDNIKNLLIEIEMLNMGSESRIKKEDELNKSRIETEVFTKFAEQNLLKKYKDFFESIYKDVSKATERFGKKNGYDLILKNEEPEFKSNDMSDLQFKIGIKSVLYFSDAVDITQLIIDNINSNYIESTKN